MNKESVQPLEDKEVTDVTSFGSKDTYIVVETIAKFGNMMNYLNTKEEIQRYNPVTQNVEIVPIEYDFLNSKEYKLVFNQVLKIVIEGTEKELTKDNFNKVINIHKTVFENALNKILKSSDAVGFTIKHSLMF